MPSAQPSHPVTIGWIEHALPDASHYYIHPSKPIITDIDLRNSYHLRAVSDYLNGDREVPAGWELWLRDEGTTGRDIKVVESWVDHVRKVLLDVPVIRQGNHDREYYCIGLNGCSSCMLVLLVFLPFVTQGSRWRSSTGHSWKRIQTFLPKHEPKP
jgi:hypothetical protein